MSKIRWTYLWIIVAFASISTILAIINLYKGAHPPTKNFTINSFPLQDTILIGIDNKIEVLMDGEEADGNVSDKFENPINDLNYRAEGNLHTHIVSCTEKSIDSGVQMSIYYADQLYQKKTFVVSEVTEEIKKRIDKKITLTNRAK